LPYPRGTLRAYSSYGGESLLPLDDVITSTVTYKSPTQQQQRRRPNNF